MTAAAEEALRACEAERCAALVAGDRERLRRLLDDGLVHVHTNGTVEDRTAYLDTAFTRLRFLEVVRDNLAIRIEGGVGLMTGELSQRIEIRASGEVVAMRAFVTQIWIEGADGWRLARFHATSVSK